MTGFRKDKLRNNIKKMTMQSNKRKIIIQGVEYDSLESAANAFGKSRNTVDYRLSQGWTPEQAVGLVPPPNFASKTTGIPVQVNGREFKNIKEAANYYNRAYTHVIEMLKKGRSIEQALGLVKRADTLQSENPELAKQWHPHKNMPLTPSDVSPGSGKKVWWLCSKNHEWEAVINSRNRGCGCPHCAGQKPTSDRNFATEYPGLLKELDLEKNKNLDPNNLSPRSSQNVWWKCVKGILGKLRLLNRTRKRNGTSCPYCINYKLCNENSLARLRPDIAQDWHPTKNKALTPNDVIAGGGNKVWWTCKHGHDWQATVGSRVNNESGCPKCFLRTSRIEIAVYSEIQALFPNASWQEKIEGYECDIFIKDRNIGIEIDGVYWHRRRHDVDTVKSKLFDKKGIQLYRLREEGLPLLSERDISFKWSDNTFPTISKLVEQILQHADLNDNERLKLHSYVNGNSLVNEKLYRKIVSNLPAPPPGKSLADIIPELAKEWAYDLNAPLTPEHFRPSANKSAWWRCKRGHTWKSVIQQRTFRRSGCLRCTLQAATSENNLAVIHPELVKEWHPEKNCDIRPGDVFPKSNQKYWWKCIKGHEWLAVVSCRASGAGCPFCYGRFASETNNLVVSYPEILAEWDAELNKGLNPSDFTPHVGKKIWWRCNKSHTWQATIYNRTKNKSGCPICARNKSRKYSIEYFQKFARERGGKCLSTEYLSCRKKIKMICKNGHEWETRADNILYEQQWCNRCRKDQ
jgi:hypothetical protein